MAGLPEEVELQWLRLLPWRTLARVSLVCSTWNRLASDELLWEAAFVQEFGSTAADDALDKLWGASPATALELRYVQPGWFARMTARARPCRREGKNFREEPAYRDSNIISNEEKWNPREILPLEEDVDHHKSVVPVQHPWRATFMRHFILRHRWLHACDPRSERPDESKIVRAVVAGMKSSGKTSFLRTLAPHDGHVEDQGINVVVAEVKGVPLVLLETRRPHGWYKQSYNGARVSGVIFVVDTTEFAPFKGEGEEETEEAYERMEDIYKRFHGITGEACQGRLGLVLCAHKSDLTQDNLEEEELTDAVKRKLRVEALQTCTWYRRAATATVATSARHAERCHFALEEFIRVNRERQLFWGDD